MVELLIFNGYPFKDHWAYWVRSHVDPDIGVMIHATGSVSSGFTFETRRNYNFKLTKNVPTKRIPLQWVNGAFFDERAMLNNGSYKTDTVPVCRFEASAYKVQCPVKSLNTTGQMSAGSVGKRVTQRDCQTWIVESADQLVQDHIFTSGTANYLRETRQ